MTNFAASDNHGGSMFFAKTFTTFWRVLASFKELQRVLGRNVVKMFLRNSLIRLNKSSLSYAVYEPRGRGFESCQPRHIP